MTASPAPLGDDAPHDVGMRGSVCHRYQWIAVGVAVVLTIAGSASSAKSSDPLSNLVANEPGASACFQRAYDAAHLARHPRQSVRSVLLSVTREIQPFEIALRVQFEDSRRPSAVLMRAGCSWQETDVNKGDFTGEPIVPNFPKNSGLGCAWLSSTGASGDESAQFPVDVDSHGHQVTIYVKSFVSAWSPEQAGLDLGSDDRIFRLDRVDGTACAGLDKVLPDTLEKALPHN